MITFKYQHGCPRRYVELSMISSDTKNAPCNFEKKINLSE